MDAGTSRDRQDGVFNCRNNRAGLHKVLFCALILAWVQLGKMDAKVRDGEQAAWLWLAIDPVTKIILDAASGRTNTAPQGRV